ncbi:MAG: tRNA lysidine(34) synthetase TilS [Bacteroidota bacterium]|nr:tRNA lysidine(34) synthetase TilS [Bacteroidota bacterium]
MSLLKRFIAHINDQHLFQKKDHLLLAVSGGIDSVVLCELCHQAGFLFEIVHCNFQLRGEESERDEKFVLSLGEKYHSNIFIKKFDTNEYVRQNNISVQVAARELRYTWFVELLTEWSIINPSECRWLLTAHHANDNIETLLMNFFKGTGIAGLHSILPRQGKLIRPLLFATKDEILEFARENDLSFVEDSSNLTDKYTRNYFRHQLIPSVQKVFPQVEGNLLNNIERFREIEILYQQSVRLHKQKLLEEKGNEIHIPVLKLLKTEPLKTIVYEIIKDFGFTAHQTDDVVHLLKSETGKYITSATHKVFKNRNWIIIAPVNTLEANHILINEKDKVTDFELGELRIKKYDLISEKIQTPNNTAMLDADNITFPLLLRKWKQGDYFYPLGIKNPSTGRLGKKKLSKFFIDQKLSLTEKEKIWVIESHKKIIWVIGHRIDDRFKITTKTQNVLEIDLC